MGQVRTLLISSSHLKHGPDVLERVSPDNGPGNLAVGCTQDCPDGLGLEQGREVGVGHLWLGEVPARLGGGGLSPCAVKPI